MRAAGLLGGMVIAFAVAGSGCRIGFDPLRDPPLIDVPPAPPLCVGTRVPVCFDQAPDMAVMFVEDTDLDTDRSQRCAQASDRSAEYCVVAATQITIAPGVTLRGHGARPLVLVATELIDIQGSIDVHSEQSAPSIPGAGAGTAASCPSDGAAPVAAGGGYGGSFQGRGGQGKPANPPELPATAPSPLDQMPELRGGCPGGDGGTVGGAVGGGAGGAGGGAVALVGGTIRIHVVPSVGACRVAGHLADGCIDASGAGGTGGAKLAGGAGGGGGGTGGMIVIDAEPFDISGARLFANGGGGGEGGGPNAPGIPGEEASGPGRPAPGGVVAANNESGDGAPGSSGTVLNGAGADDSTCCGGGGGGGGGAAGYIRAPVFTDGEVDPPPTDPPPPH